MADRAVILFDGVCNLCNAWVDFVVRHDVDGKYRFAPLQSDVANDLLRGAPADLPDSIVLVEGKDVWVRSTAALRVARGIGLPWSLAYVFILVPRPVRDAVYDWVARHRYRWFGRRDTCRVPTPEERARFLG